MSSKTRSKAEIEFEIMEQTSPDAVVLKFKDEILKLVDKFGNSGQSGGSAPFVSKIISNVVKKLCMQESISPITGEDNEWFVYMETTEKFFQNYRESGIFKSKNDNPHYVDAIVFKEENGNCFTGTADVPEEYIEKYGDFISSSQYIKSFPFEPKTFYIDVTSKEYADKEGKEEKVGGGWWNHWIKDPKQLEEVFEYYDLKKRFNEEV